MSHIITISNIMSVENL